VLVNQQTYGHVLLLSESLDAGGAGCPGDGDPGKVKDIQQEVGGGQVILATLCRGGLGD